MITISDATGSGESEILPTPDVDQQLKDLGFEPVGCLRAAAKGASHAQFVAVWRSPRSDAFAVPEVNPRGDERFCYFRTLLVDGGLIDTSNEPETMVGFLGGRARGSVPGAGYDVDSVSEVSMAELWRRHQQRIAARTVAPRRHRSMAALLSLSRHSVALFSRALMLGLLALFGGAGFFVIAVTTWWSLTGLPEWLKTLTLLAGATGLAFGLQVGMAAVRRLPSWFWPKAGPAEQ